jgi:hypothetical protein
VRWEVGVQAGECTSSWRPSATGPRSGCTSAFISSTRWSGKDTRVRSWDDEEALEAPPMVAPAPSPYRAAVKLRAHSQQMAVALGTVVVQSFERYTGRCGV